MNGEDLWASQQDVRKLYEQVIGAFPPGSDRVKTLLLNISLEHLEPLRAVFSKTTLEKAARKGLAVHAVWLLVSPLSVSSLLGNVSEFTELELLIRRAREHKRRAHEVFALVLPRDLVYLAQFLKRNILYQHNPTRVRFSGSGMAQVEGLLERDKPFVVCRYLTVPLEVDVTEQKDDVANSLDSTPPPAQA